MPRIRRNRPTRAHFLALILLLGACGCRAPKTLADHAVRVDTLGDTVRVRTLSGSVWGDTAELVPETTIGLADGPEEYTLGAVRSLAVSQRGEVFVMDGEAPALRKYSADGSFLRTFGREGSGPGEYREPDGGLAVFSDGRVVLRDPGNARFTIYAADGTYLGQWPAVGGFGTGRRLYRTHDDHLYTTVRLEADLPPWQWAYGLAHYTPSGTILDTLIVPRFGYEPPIVSGQRDRRTSTQYVPFSATAPWALSPSGYVVTGIGDDYQVTLFRPQGILRLERTVAPVPVLPAEGEERRAQVTWDMEGKFPRWRWNGPAIPSTKPAYTDLLPADDGRIWVRLSTVGERVAEGASDLPPSNGRPPRPQLRYRERVAFDVFEVDGNYLGHVAAPDGFQLAPTPVIRGDTIWAVSIDPTQGFPQVVRYRLVR